MFRCRDWVESSTRLPKPLSKQRPEARRAGNRSPARAGNASRYEPCSLRPTRHPIQHHRAGFVANHRARSCSRSTASTPLVVISGLRTPLLGRSGTTRQPTSQLPHIPEWRAMDWLPPGRLMQFKSVGEGPGDRWRASPLPASVWPRWRLMKPGTQANKPALVGGLLRGGDLMRGGKSWRDREAIGRQLMPALHITCWCQAACAPAKGRVRD